MRSILINALLKQLEENPKWLSWLDKELQGKNLIALMTANNYETWKQFYSQGLKALQQEIPQSPRHQFAFYILIARIFREYNSLDTWGRWLGSESTLNHKKKGFAEIENIIGKIYIHCHEAHIKRIRALVVTYGFDRIQEACKKHHFAIVANSVEEINNADASFYEALEPILTKEHFMANSLEEDVFLTGIKKFGEIMFKKGSPLLNYYSALNEGRAKDFLQIILQFSDIKSPQTYLAFKDEQEYEYRWF